MTPSSRRRGRSPRDANTETAAEAEPHRRFSVGARVLVAMLSLLVLVGGAGVGAVWWLQHSLMSNVESLGNPFSSVAHRPTYAQAAQDTDSDGVVGDAVAAPMTFLVVGSDSRISAGDPSQWAYGAQRTDAIMLMQISGDRKHVYSMSIPRDSWVDIPGHGTAKINAAFSWGGPSLLIETIEQLTGIRIDHLVVTDFESFKAMTDELGGVTMTVPEGSKTISGEYLAGGTMTLDGDQALAYVRERKSLPRGDFDRVQRQQEWMKAIAASARESGVLTDPTRLVSFLDVVSGSVAADEELTPSVMFELAWGMRNVQLGDVDFFTAPYLGTGRSPDGAQSIVNLDTAALADLSAAWREDTLGTYLAAHAAELDSVTSLG